MSRLLVFSVLVLATSAFATGERIVLVGEASALRDSLCVSMTCEAGAKDFTVSGRNVKAGVEFTVTSATGQRRLTHVALTNTNGRISAMELVRASSLVLHAIEAGPAAAKPAKVRSASSRRLRGAYAKR